MLSENSLLLETAFKILNQKYFSDSLPDVVITIQSSPKSYGYITTQKVWKDNGNNYYEINISAEHLSRPIENVLATLMHEMVHLYCMINGIADTSKNGRYHNKRFQAEAQKRDLKIEYAQYIGYSITSPTESFIGMIRKHGLLANIDRCRVSGDAPPSPVGGNDDDTKKKKGSTRKYVCKSCGISVRATKDVNIICGDCMCPMEKV